MLLRRARTAILPVIALAAWGVTAWVASLRRSGPDGDDVIPALVTGVLSVWALLAYFYRKFWAESRKVRFENAVAAMGVGVRVATETILGDGQRDGDGPSSQRRLSAGPAGPR